MVAQISYGGYNIFISYGAHNNFSSSFEHESEGCVCARLLARVVTRFMKLLGYQLPFDSSVLHLIEPLASLLHMESVFLLFHSSLFVVVFAVTFYSLYHFS